MITALILALSFVITFLPPLSGQAQLILSHPTFISIFSCHLSHWSLNHAMWDMGMFAVLAGHLEYRWSRKYFVFTVLILALTISLGLVTYDSDFSTYRGLSGICMGLFAALLFESATNGVRDRNGALLFFAILGMLGLIAKIIYELRTGSALFVEAYADGYHVVVESHLLGCMAALFTWGVTTMPSPLRMYSSIKTIRASRRSVSEYEKMLISRLTSAVALKTPVLRRPSR